ncbi:MAG: Crp/Fnr family transcriptional regulator [Peptoniphilaceae bacterium]|nr:Crp/Fnr family transcriptional regulator [Peptoniphilaceae bacterium]MDY3738707.1 Crp/Fnr family transcriptional regulator [Peptoniphilaceae bacterium]
MNLRDISIFKNTNDEDTKKIEENLEIKKVSFKKDSYIFRQNEMANDLFYLIKGDIIVSKIDYNGKRSIVQNFTEKSVFGEIYAYLNETYDFSAIANEDSLILIIKDFKKIFNLDLDKSFLISFIDLLAKKCMLLSRKNQISTQFTLRQKIANYLIYNEEKNIVKLEMTREELADFLSTTRPSLSRELSKMKSERIIDVNGKTIEILDKDTIIDLTY